MSDRKIIKMRRRKRFPWTKLFLVILILVLAGGWFWKNKEPEIQLGEEGVSYYYYNRIEDDFIRKQYNSILKGLYKQKKNIKVNIKTKAQLQMLMNMVLYDHPELFWVSTDWEAVTISDAPLMVSPHYFFSVEERDARKAEMDAALEEALSGIPDSASDYEKIKSIFEYVTETVSYDLESPDNQTIYSSLVNKVSVCAGYAKVVQFLAQKLGLEALYVVGDVIDGGPHAWNIVMCDGKYYQVDATFGDVGDEERSDKMACDYTFLCITDEEMYGDRTLGEYQDPPVCDSPDLNYYSLNDLMFANVDDAKESICQGLTGEEQFWCGAFTDQKIYKKVRMGLKSGSLFWGTAGQYAQDINEYYYMDDDARRVLYIYLE